MPRDRARQRPAPRRAWPARADRRSTRRHRISLVDEVVEPERLVGSRRGLAPHASSGLPGGHRGVEAGDPWSARAPRCPRPCNTGGSFLRAFRDHPDSKEGPAGLRREAGATVAVSEVRSAPTSSPSRPSGSSGPAFPASWVNTIDEDDAGRPLVGPGGARSRPVVARPGRGSATPAHLAGRVRRPGIDESRGPSRRRSTAPAPRSANTIGEDFAGPILVGHGRAEARFLSPIARHRGDLVPALLRARRRLRPRGLAHEGRSRRRAGASRAEGVDLGAQAALGCCSPAPVAGCRSTRASPSSCCPMDTGRRPSGRCGRSPGGGVQRGLPRRRAGRRLAPSARSTRVGRSRTSVLMNERSSRRRHRRRGAGHHIGRSVKAMIRRYTPLHRPHAPPAPGRGSTSRTGWCR